MPSCLMLVGWMRYGKGKAAHTDIKFLAESHRAPTRSAAPRSVSNGLSHNYPWQGSLSCELAGFAILQVAISRWNST